MGAYVNPNPSAHPQDVTFGRSKEEWLTTHGKTVTRCAAAAWTDFENDLLVCLVQNIEFSAAGIAYCREELNSWLADRSGRPMRFFSVPKEKLLQVSRLQEYLEFAKGTN